MTILIVGASGATGVRLVEELLNRGHNVKTIVRSPDRLPDKLRVLGALELIQASVLELSDRELELHVAGCDAVASCLGHNLTFKAHKYFFGIGHSYCRYGLGGAFDIYDRKANQGNRYTQSKWCFCS